MRKLPRTPKIEQHERFEEFKRLLLDPNSPSGTQRMIAKTVGVTEQAISQYKRSLLQQVKEAVQKKIEKRKHEGLIEDYAELEINEVERLAKNIARLEEIIGPLHSIVAEMVQKLSGETYYNLDVGMVHLIRGLLVDSTKMLETSKKVKGELAPEIQISLQINEFKTQVLQLNEFVFELLKAQPELLDKYEAFVVEKKDA